MRHHVAERKLGVKTAHRQAMLANLASSLVLKDSIATTLPRAKELKRIADRIVTLSKRGTVQAARRARQILKNREAVRKAFQEFSKRFSDRNGGYTRILKLGYRHGDSAPMAVIEYLPSPQMEEKRAQEKAARAKEKKEKKEEKAGKKTTMSLKDRVMAKMQSKGGAKAKAQMPSEKKAAPRKVPQQRAKKEA
jgi:large subunit ribosomal protein L17